ncbi:TPA: DUF4935 domain-containing protein [Vibrio parahaemolyticus]|nr:DUF4935 domain-containing protein [Vibrio parahaemolyticus]
MKDQFKGFYSLDEDEYIELWNNATFILDTNVLLNLYRYREDTTEQLIKVIEQLKGRVWIPYHVALEYQRNRLKVIGSQNSKFSEVKKVVQKGTNTIKSDLDTLQLKKRHSTIEPESFIDEINTATSKFLKELEELEKFHFSVMNEDKIRVRLDELLNQKVGSQPESQTVIDNLEKEAEQRFKKKIPPGYMDDDKDKSDDPTFSYSNLTYQRKYSDYIVWSQIIEYANAQGLSDLIFVTDDNKEDWWLKVKQNGEKTIAPRPELSGELFQRTKIKRFHMYSSEGFLNYANKNLSAGVSTAAIEEVRDVAMTRNDDEYQLSEIEHSIASAEDAVLDWLWTKHSLNIKGLTVGPFDLITLSDKKKIGYIVKAISHPSSASRVLNKILHDSFPLANEYNVDEVVIAIALLDDSYIPQLVKLMELKSKVYTQTTFLLGLIDHNKTNDTVSFIEYGQIRHSDS